MTEKTCETCANNDLDENCSACRMCSKALSGRLPGWEPKPSAEPVADPDGWIEWGGGKCPVKPGVIVVSIRRNGVKFAAHGITLRWEHWHEQGAGRDYDIVRYRVVKPASEPEQVAEPETVRDYDCHNCDYTSLDGDDDPCVNCYDKEGEMPSEWQPITVSAKSSSAFASQVGGSHYTQMAIHPAEYIHRNGIGFMEGSAIAYLSRWQNKNGVEDLRKAVHFVQLLIEMEEGAAK